MRILVTGAAGFIGSHLVARLLDTSAHVRALVRPGTDASRLEAKGVDVARGDIRDAASVRKAMAGREIVYHLVKAPNGSPVRLLDSVNALGTANVGRAAAEAGVLRLVHASSAAVYGSALSGSVLREDTPLRPDSAYGRSKRRAEQAVPTATIARIATVIGPGAKGWGGLFAAIEAKRFRMPGAGLNYHHLVDVADLVDGLLLCAATPNVEGRAYNLAGAEPIRLRDLLRLIVQELGMGDAPPPPIPASLLRVYRRISDAVVPIAGVPLPRAESIAHFLHDRVLDISLARRELGYAPQIGTLNAVRRAVAWYRGAADGERAQGAVPRVHN
jgi:nucleoside-diphosphate-sugar epimerase